MEIVKESEAEIKNAIDEFRSVIDVGKGFLMEFDFIQSIDLVRDDILFVLKVKKVEYRYSYRRDVRKLLSLFTDDIMIGNLIRTIIRANDNIAELESFLEFDKSTNSY